MRTVPHVVLTLAGWLCLMGPPGALAQGAPPGQAPVPPVVDRTRDRGEGLPTSMFGTYIRRGELLVYPFFEYYRDRNFEYAPDELGAVGDVDFRGRYRAKEGLLFVGYGITDRLAVEFEVAGITAAFERSPDDRSGLPPRIEESGLGDVEGQIRWRWNRESDGRPEVFSYGEFVVPHHEKRVLIGTPGVEVKFGTGIVRGFSWGTLTARAAVEYDEASTSSFDSGEYALEYLRRLSPQWRVFLGIEGAQDEVSFIGEVQWHVSPRVFLKFNNGVGVTSKSPDWAPEVGIVFSFGDK